MSGQRFDARLMQPPFPTVQGTFTTVAHAAGATTLLVEMAGDFDDAPEQGVAYLRIVPAEAPDVDPVAPFVAAYSTWDGELEEQEFIVLTTGLPAAVPAGSEVQVWSGDLTAGEPVSVYEALVMPDDEDVNAEPLTVTVHPDLIDTMGSLDGLTADTPVLVETQESYDPYGDEDGDDELFLTRVLGGDLVRDGSFIDETTLPVPEGVVLEPTAPPASSPAPVVEEGPASVIVRVPRVSDAQTYELHVAAGTTTTDGDGNTVPVAPSAAPSSATLHTADAPELLTVSQYGGPDRPEIPVETTAWFAVVATNGGDLRAAPSAWVAGQRGQIPEEYMRLLVGTVLAQRVFGEVLEGVTVRGSTFETTATPNRGIKIDTALRIFDLLGDFFFVADPAASDLQVTGVGKFKTVTTSDGASFGGDTEIPTNAKLKAKAATGAPSGAPAVSAGYATQQFTDDGFWGDRRGWAGDGTYWFTSRPGSTAATVILERWSALAGTLNTSVTLTFTSAVRRLCGIAYSNGRVVVMVERKTIASDNSPNFSRRVAFATATAALSSVVMQNDYGPSYDDTANTLGHSESEIVRRELSTSLNRDYFSNLRVLSDGTVGAGTEFSNFNTPSVATEIVAPLVLATPFTSRQAVVANGASGAFVARAASTDSAISANGWPSAPGTKVGFTYRSGAFHSMSATGVMTTYTDHPGGDVFVSSTFARGGTLTTAPTAETTQSPRTMYTIPKRGGITVTASAVPPNAGTTGPTHVRIFAGTGSTDPGRTAMRIQAAPAAGTRTALLTSIATTGAVPPATSSFSGGTPGGWEAESGGMNFDGNSSGSAGTGSFFTDLRDRITSYITGLVNTASSLQTAIRSAVKSGASVASQPVTPASGSTAGSQAPSVETVYGTVLLGGIIAKSSGNYTADTSTEIGSISSADAPATNLRFVVPVGLGYGHLIVTSAGVISIRPIGASLSPVYLTCSWPSKTVTGFGRA